MADAHPLEPGDPEWLGPYRITARIGEGGQGVVYLAESETGERVAVKLLRAGLGRDPAARDAFMRELEVAKRVARFCTAQVLDFGIAGGRPYLVSEYVPGPSLHEVVGTRGPLSGSTLERLAVATATALVALHDAGVVHRDLKPQNVLLGPDGPRVIDFGIARALAGTSTMTSQVVGTPAYMAPEQLAAGQLGFAVDVFAWASTMAFAASGRPPFGDDAIPAIINRILNEEPRLDGIDPPLRSLLADCLAKDPLRRPSAREVLDRLVSAPSKSGVAGGAAGPVPVGGQGAAGGPTEAGGGRGPRRGRRVAAVSTALVAAAAAAVLTAALLSDDGMPPTRMTEAGAAVTSATPSGTAPSGAASGEAAPTDAPTAEATAHPVRRETQRPANRRGREHGTAAPSPVATRRPSSRPSTRPSSRPSPKPSSKPSPRPRPSPTPSRLVELGPGHFTAYCKSLGWEWVEYRESPRPGAYCIKRKGDTLFLTQDMRDKGCRWRYHEPAAVHRFKGKSNYCYVYR